MIKKLTSADIDYIEQIFNLEKEIFKNSAFSIDYLKTLIKNNNSFIYIYLIDNQVCGYLMVLDSIDVYEILAIATVEEYRNKGIAQELLDKIKMKDIFLEVRESNQVAINFYKKNKFNQISIRKNYYSEPAENAIIDRKRGTTTIIDTIKFYCKYRNLKLSINSEKEKADFYIFENFTEIEKINFLLTNNILIISNKNVEVNNFNKIIDDYSIPKNIEYIDYSDISILKRNNNLYYPFLTDEEKNNMLELIRENKVVFSTREIIVHF